MLPATMQIESEVFYFTAKRGIQGVDVFFVTKEITLRIIPDKILAIKLGKFCISS